MPTADRSFSLLDAIVLIAALAAGFALTRDTFGLSMISDGVSIHFRLESGDQTVRGAKNSWVWYPPPSSSQFGLWSLRIQQPIFRVTPCLASFTLAVLGLSLRRPRPPLRRLFRRPGAVAGLAVALALAAVALQYPMLWLGKGGVRTNPNPGDNWQLWRLQLWFFLPRQAGFAVATSWLVLWLSGCWSARPGWLDRLGRGLGACWAALALATVVASFLFGLSV